MSTQGIADVKTYEPSKGLSSTGMGTGSAPYSSDYRPSSARVPVSPSLAHSGHRQRPSSGVPRIPPKWIAMDRQVLSFEAYFKEKVDESRIERVRVRRCVIQAYLEDDSFKVSEPREANSGMFQGVFLKRHRITKPDGTFYSWRDIHLGMDLTLYGRTFRIIDCDERTRVCGTRCISDIAEFL